MRVIEFLLPLRAETSPVIQHSATGMDIRVGCPSRQNLSEDAGSVGKSRCGEGIHLPQDFGWKAKRDLGVLES